MRILKELISWITAVVLTIGFLPTIAKSQVTIFNGKWEIVKEQTDFGGLEAKVAAPLSVSADSSTDTVRVSRYFEGQSAAIEKYKLGAFGVETIIDKNTLKLADVNWSQKTNELVFKSTYELNGAQFVYWRTEIWSLKGDFLEITRATVMPDKVDRVKAIYKRTK